ncbi:hypothetical protein [Bacillus sp. EB600]|nr:hypothetical protein [Bacillus sp. EB600]MCQ6282236.1 hypothetical protein [Bacillus sp. EB600]
MRIATAILFLVMLTVQVKKGVVLYIFQNKSKNKKMKENNGGINNEGK